MDALVTDAQHKSVVAALRALGRNGVRVLAVSPHRSAAGLWSRYAAGRAVGPDPGTDPSAFVETIRELVDRHGVRVVYPGTEESIGAILPRWSRIGDGAVLPYPGPESLRRIRDKRLLPGTAEAVGLRTPATLMECTADELAKRSVDLPIPCIIKPADPAARPMGVHAISSPQDLEFALRRRRLPVEMPLVAQEWVRGPLISVELVLSREGEVTERFQQVASRTWPSAAGSISLATSVDADERLIEQSAEMLRRVGYWGLAQLDFVVQGPDAPVLIDVNPRFYACMPLALGCGVNLPAAWHEVALGGAAAGPSKYRKGVTFRWLEGDLVGAARGDLRRLRTPVRTPTVGSMWDSEDPRAAVLLGARAVALRARRAVRRLLPPRRLGE